MENTIKTDNQKKNITRYLTIIMTSIGQKNMAFRLKN